MGDRLLIGFVAALLAFLIGLAIGYGDLAEALRTFPAPATTWVTLLTGVAWPLVVLVIAWRWHREISVGIGHLARRMATDDVEVAGLKVTLHDQVTAAPAPAASLLERIGHDAELKRRVGELVLEHLGPGVDVLDFLTSTAYVEQRAALLGSLMKD